MLRLVGEVLTEQVRSTDVVYRDGGEEFCVLLAGASVELATSIAERIRSAISAIDLTIDAQLTVSIGVATGHVEPVSQVVVSTR